MNHLKAMDQRNGAPLLAIVGPTAIGKTNISIQLGARFSGEIVSADSRLLYKGLDIGTAKPSSDERLIIPHHLIDICRPDETITLGQYKRMAVAAIDAIQKKGDLPLLVGGTGQYVRAIIEGWGIPEVPPQERLRDVLESLGEDELNLWLRQLDPISARRIESRNIRRVIRAIEVTLITGQPMSVMQRKSPPAYEVRIIGLTCDRRVLYERIDARVNEMMQTGFLDEVAGLRRRGYDRRLPSMSGLGYRQLWAYLEGECELDEAIERIKFETHRFARQQYTWFRLDDSNITWFNVQGRKWEKSVELFVEQWLKGKDLLH